MTLRSGDLQSDSDLDSIRNSCDVCSFLFHRTTMSTITTMTAMTTMTTMTTMPK